jgi:hypothetical protein
MLAVIGELVARYITGSFEALRVSVMLTVTLGLAMLLLYSFSQSPRKRIVVDSVSLSIGVFTIAAGMVLSVQDNLQEGERLWIARYCLIGLGLLQSVLASYSLYMGLSGRDIDFMPMLNLRDRLPRTTAEDGQEVAVTELVALRTEHKAILEMLRAQVHVEDLHFVAYYVGGRCMFMVDVLDNAALNRFFQDTERQARRAQYERHGRQIIWLVGALDRSFKRIQGGMLIRTVLDVQYGALYHFPIAVGVDLVGVTLIQERVPEADAKLVAIRDEMADLPRGGKLSARPLQESAYYVPAPESHGKAVPLHRRRHRSTIVAQHREGRTHPRSGPPLYEGN